MNDETMLTELELLKLENSTMKLREAQRVAQQRAEAHNQLIAQICEARGLDPMQTRFELDGNRIIDLRPQADEDAAMRQAPNPVLSPAGIGRTN